MIRTTTSQGAGAIAMPGNDLLTDCKTLFNKHPCRIILSGVAILVTVLLWYANRMETITMKMQDALVRIETNVARIQGSIERPAAPNAVAMQPAEQ
jgi:hypothetical protein